MKHAFYGKCVVSAGVLKIWHAGSENSGSPEGEQAEQAPSLSQPLCRGECRAIDALLARLKQGRGQRRRWADGRDLRPQPGRAHQGSGRASEGGTLPGQTGPTRLHPQREWKKRALCIPALEDKLVQLACAKLLSAIYEAESSHGYWQTSTCTTPWPAVSNLRP